MTYPDNVNIKEMERRFPPPLSDMQERIMSKMMDARDEAKSSLGEIIARMSGLGMLDRRTDLYASLVDAHSFLPSDEDIEKKARQL